MQTHMKTEVRTDAGLLAVTQPVDQMLVLFYTSWCPYSRMFLPIFERFAQSHEGSCVRVLLDDGDPLWDKYEIRVVPTVLLFQKGKVAQRLDGVPGEGLTDVQFQEFARSSLQTK